jgi:hypothetical protein
LTLMCKLIIGNTMPRTTKVNNYALRNYELFLIIAVFFFDNLPLTFSYLLTFLHHY